MQALFPRWSNSVARGVLASGAAGLVGFPALCMGLVRTPWITHVGQELDQPIPFDHRHHVRDDGIACLYCHWEAERTRFAGIPPTVVCMGCHAQIRTEAPALDPLWASANTGQPIRWRRVHDLPDFVFFDHSSHIHRGVDCTVCHGDVSGMASVVRVSPLTMQWCLSCHRSHGASVDCATCHR